MRGWRRGVDVSVRFVGWAGLVCLAIAFIRWQHVPAYGNWKRPTANYSDEVTGLFFAAGIVGLLAFLLVWSLLRRKPEGEVPRAASAPSDPGHRQGRVVVDADLAATIQLVAGTVRHLQFVFDAP